LEINFAAHINHSNLYYLMKVFQIWQNFKSGPILAKAGYQPDLQKGGISAGDELQYSPT